MKKVDKYDWGTKDVELELYVGTQGRHLTGLWHGTSIKVFCQCYRMDCHISWGYCNSQGKK